MSESVVFDINGDPKGAEKAFARLQKELDKSKQKVADLTGEANKSAKAADKLGESFAKSAQDSEKMGAGFVKNLGSAVSVAAMLTAALKLTKAEYDNIIERQQKANQTVIGTANSEMAMLRNVSPQDHAYWRSQAGGMARRTGQSIGAIHQAIADASSAQGNQSNDQLRRNVELAMMVSPENPAEAQTIAGGLGDASRLTGSGDERVNMGAILAMGKQARVRSTPKIAQNLIPAAVSTMGYGGTASEAMAIGTTLSTLMNDQTGDVTKTTSIRMASELDRLFGEGKSPLEHITAIQNDPKLLQRWLKGAKGVTPGQIPTEADVAFKNLVTKGSDADKLLRSNLSGYGSDADMAKLTDDWMKSAYASEPQRIAQEDRALASDTNALEFGDTKGASAGGLRKRTDDVLVASKASWLERTIYARGFDYAVGTGTKPEVAALATMVGRRNSLRDDSRLTEEQRQSNQPAIDILNARITEMVAELKGLRTDQKNAPKPRSVDAHN